MSEQTGVFVTDKHCQPSLIFAAGLVARLWTLASILFENCILEVKLTHTCMNNLQSYIYE